MSRLPAFVLALALLPTVALADDIASPARVIDGDTIEIAGHRIRLHGIDAPEIRQTCWDKNGEFMCGRNMRQSLIAIIRKGPVTCRPRSKDRYKRVVAVCFSWEGLELGRAMVLGGWALAYRKYSTDYVLEEKEARRLKAGMWGYLFTPPWDWRKMVRDAK